MKHPLISRPYVRSYLKRTLPEEKPDREPHEKTGTTVVAAIREYLSDILGAFMPGVYFSFHLVVSALLLLFMVNSLEWKDVVAFVQEDSQFLGMLMPFAVFVFCFFSYIIGSVFYRKDTKEPDTASALRTYQKSGDTEREGLAFNFDKIKGDPLKLLTRLYAEILFRVDFPYSHLKRYLETRNYTHLAKHIPWDGRKEDGKKEDGRKEDVSQRSKTFINILKSRIQTYAPQEMPVIEKNEAHIRLMNSLWYAAKSIVFITYVAFAVVLCFYLWHDFIFRYNFIKFDPLCKVQFKQDFAFSLGFFSIAQFAIAKYIRRSIKQYFHYMRVREILYILEIADTIDRYNDDIDMFAGLKPPPEKQEGNCLRPAAGY
jgi:hypothetical protein